MKNRIFILIVFILSICIESFAQENKKDANGLKQGAWVKYDATTKAKIYEGSFVDDKPNGLFKYYTPQGKIKAITTYSDKGKKAKALLFDDKGNKIAEGNYLNEKKDSTWNYYNPDHVLIAQENYSNTKKNGAWKVFYENGKLYEEINWKDSIKDGKWQQYFNNGMLKTDANFVQGQLDGSIKLYQEDGKPDMTGTYVNALREGVWLYYLPSGEIKLRENYSKGKLKNKEPLNGVINENYDNEILKSSYTYKNGKKNGEFTEYYNAGEWKLRLKPAEGEFPPEEEQYFTGQKVKRKGNFIDDQLDGKIISYKLDGKVESEKEYKNGTVISKK
jgi:antitoxin component YwqK of YwqJK toxin-antitoxin module